jgi:hypothetical protein
MDQGSIEIKGDVTNSAVIIGNGNQVTLRFGDKPEIKIYRKQIGHGAPKRDLDILNPERSPITLQGRAYHPSIF